MIVARSMHDDWLSNAYLVADEPGGTAVFVDSGAPLEPLYDVVEAENLNVTHLLTTHAHHDHVAGHDELRQRFGLQVVAEAGRGRSGGLEWEGLETPGHSDDGLSFVVNGEVCFSGDTLFRGSVGGGDVEGVRRSVMDVLMALPRDTDLYPGHAEESTIGHERDENPFVRVWAGDEPEGDEPCRVRGEEATLLVWSPDYDGAGKAWVRFAGGREAIVGGSRIER